MIIFSLFVAVGQHAYIAMNRYGRDQVEIAPTAGPMSVDDLPLLAVLRSLDTIGDLDTLLWRSQAPSKSPTT